MSSTVDIGPAVFDPANPEAEETLWERAHPPQLTVNRVVHGSRVQRWSSLDVGQIRMVLFVFEVLGVLKVASMDAGEINTVLFKNKLHLMDETETSDAKIQKKLQKTPMLWKLRSRAYAHQIRPIAIYVINLRRCSTVHWIHPRVYQNEVEPMVEALEKIQTSARTIREEAMPVYTFQEEYDSEQDPIRLRPAFFTASYMKSALQPPAERVSTDQRGYDMIALARAMVDMLTRPEYVPYIGYLGTLAVENQPDIVRRYVTEADRDDELFRCLCSALEKTTDSAIQHKLLERYHWHLGMTVKRRDESGRENYGPINWGLSNMFITATHAVSRLYGHTADRPVIFAMDKGIGEFEKETLALKRNPYVKASATNHYEYLKQAAQAVWQPFYEAKEAQEPDVYGNVLQTISKAVERSAFSRDQVKMDDITDPTGQGIRAVENNTRSTKYTGENDAENLTEYKQMQLAALLWKNASSRPLNGMPDDTSSYGKILSMRERMIMSKPIGTLNKPKVAQKSTRPAPAAAPKKTNRLPAAVAATAKALARTVKPTPIMETIDLTETIEVELVETASSRPARVQSMYNDDDDDDMAEVEVVATSANSSQSTPSSSPFANLDAFHAKTKELLERAKHTPEYKQQQQDRSLKQLRLVKPKASPRVGLSEPTTKQKKKNEPNKKKRPLPSNLLDLESDNYDASEMSHDGSFHASSKGSSHWQKKQGTSITTTLSSSYSLSSTSHGSAAKRAKTTTSTASSGAADGFTQRGKSNNSWTTDATLNPYGGIE